MNALDQTSGMTSATDLATGVATSLPTTVPFGAVTTSSLTTSSTPQTTSTTPTTTSESPTSSPSSTPLHTTSSAASLSLSSSVPPSSTTQPLIPSPSSQQGTQTIITSAYTTYVNGSPLVTQTSFPSTIPQISNSSSSERTAIIAGAAAGGTALLILLLSLAFFARRKRFKQLDFLQSITLKRNQERSRATLLDGEDNLDLTRPPWRYAEYDTPWDARASRDGSDRALIGGRTTPGRWSETRSAFGEEVWPPPTANEATRLIDPLAHNKDDDVDLSRIVDDVMGPPAHFSDRSVSSMYRDSVVESDVVVHSRTVSNASNAALLDVAGLGAVGASTAPVRSSPLTQPGTKPGPGSAEAS